MPHPTLSLPFHAGAPSLPAATLSGDGAAALAPLPPLSVQMPGPSAEAAVPGVQGVSPRGSGAHDGSPPGGAGSSAPGAGEAGSHFAGLTTAQATELQASASALDIHPSASPGMQLHECLHPLLTGVPLLGERAGAPPSGFQPSTGCAHVRSGPPSGSAQSTQQAPHALQAGCAPECPCCTRTRRNVFPAWPGGAKSAADASATLSPTCKGVNPRRLEPEPSATAQLLRCWQARGRGCSEGSSAAAP